MTYPVATYRVSPTAATARPGFDHPALDQLRPVAAQSAHPALTRFLARGDGALTVDWTVLMAAVAVLGLVAMLGMPSGHAPRGAGYAAPVTTGVAH